MDTLVGTGFCYMYTPEFTDMTGWKIPEFSISEIHRLVHGGFSIVMLVFGGVAL